MYMKRVELGVRDKLAHLGYCGIAAGCGCCTAERASHIHAASSPNSAEQQQQKHGEINLKEDKMSYHTFLPPLIQLMEAQNLASNTIKLVVCNI